MRTLAIFLLTLLPACSRPNGVPKIGQFFKIGESKESYFVNCNDAYPFAIHKIGGIEFLVATRNDRVVFVETRDPNFSTPEGIRVGSSLDQVLAARGDFPGNECHWACHSKLPSGWHADFGGSFLNQETSRSTARVYRLFKRS